MSTYSRQSRPSIAGRGTSPDQSIDEDLQGANATSSSPRLWRFASWHAPQRLPREGPAPGAGMMEVHDRSIFDNQVREAIASAAELPPGLSSSKRRSSTAANRKIKKNSRSESNSTSQHRDGTTRSSGSTTGSPRSSVGGDKRPPVTQQRLGPEERRRRELMSKWEKTQALRERDQKDMKERCERRRDDRDDRFKRLDEEVSGRGGLAYQTAMALRDRENRDWQRRCDLHADWEEKIYCPMATTAFEHLNQPNRAVQQLMGGSKSVSFTMPGDKVTLVHKVHECPLRKPLVDLANENAFHVTATQVLGRSASAPSMPGAPRHMFGKRESVIASATSRPVLEPEDWSQTRIQGTLFGHFAQKAEEGEGFCRSLRGGSGVHLPDESDGIFAAGTRVHREFGRHDKGILRGTSGSQGESSLYKAVHGSSCGAPAQDHYTFGRGTAITAIEFPKGKKMDLNFH